MTHIIAVGISHKTSPVEVRERFFLNPTERKLLLQDLKNDPRVIEAFVLSTCNRTEVYARLLDADPALLMVPLFRLKKEESGAKKYFYVYAGREAVDHFLRVTAGLESIVLGETQILGQVKAAIELSREEGMIAKEFNLLANTAVRAGKKAHAETAISCGGSSVSWAAVKEAQRHFRTLRGRPVLVMGTGKMGNLTLGQLENEGIGELYLMNRTREKVRELLDRYRARAVSFWDLKNCLVKVDVCICSTAAPHYLIDRELMEEVVAAREGREILLIDISVPRNIHPDAGRVENVTLLTVDDMDRAIDQTLQKRAEAVDEVEWIVEEKVNKFYDKVLKCQRFEEAASLRPAA